MVFCVFLWFYALPRGEGGGPKVTGIFGVPRAIGTFWGYKESFGPLRGSLSYDDDGNDTDYYCDNRNDANDNDKQIITTIMSMSITKKQRSVGHLFQ